jgi:hypothetical protein
MVYDFFFFNSLFYKIPPCSPPIDLSPVLHIFPLKRKGLISAFQPFIPPETHIFISTPLPPPPPYAPRDGGGEGWRAGANTLDCWVIFLGIRNPSI